MYAYWQVRTSNMLVPGATNCGTPHLRLVTSAIIICIHHKQCIIMGDFNGFTCTWGHVVGVILYVYEGVVCVVQSLRCRRWSCCLIPWFCNAWFPWSQMYTATWQRGKTTSHPRTFTADSYNTNTLTSFDNCLQAEVFISPETATCQKLNKHEKPWRGRWSVGEASFKFTSIMRCYWWSRGKKQTTSHNTPHYRKLFFFFLLLLACLIFLIAPLAYPIQI